MATRRKKPGAKKEPRARRGSGARAVPAAVPGGRQERALADVAKVLRGLDAPAAVIGGIAVITWGRARSTGDVDVAVYAPVEAVDEVSRVFADAGFVAREPDAVAFARESFVLLLEHAATGIPIDVSLAQLDFERRALEASEERAFGSVSIPVPGVSDLVIYKLLAGRPRDLEDVEALIALGYELDTEHIERELDQFDELLETDRLGDWRRLRGRA